MSTITLRYFASLREQLGSGEAVEIAPDMTVGALRDLLIGRGGAHAAALARSRLIRCALNQQLCKEEALIGDGAEVAFFPPVTGG
jgi:molybdopterin synthase sulfur carrier subunit